MHQEKDQDEKVVDGVMPDNASGTILQDEPPHGPEHELFKQFDEAIRERRAWTSEDALALAESIEVRTGGAGSMWHALKRELPAHTQWPTERLVALTMRLQGNEDPRFAGDSELLHAQG